MNSAGWIAVLAGIIGGSVLYARTHGKSNVRKPLMIAMWAVALLAVLVGFGAIFSG
jgi:hypothetical protein